MPPVMKVAVGLAVVFGALRLNGFDLLVDPVGWGLCSAGLAGLRRSADDAFGRARSCAVTLVCASLAVLLTTGTDSEHDLLLSAVGHVARPVSAAGGLLAVWLIADAVIRRIRPRGDVFGAVLLDVLRWAVVGLGAIGMLAGYGYAEESVVTVVGWFAALVALIVVLFRLAGRPFLLSPQEPLPSRAEPAGPAGAPSSEAP
ncbi:hypothetical protein [Streptosporangium sp. NPDC023615]|uniref:hypothetical protein n=1 Tax=Streptosporangium sp. NPDC023615 TaxID=3154794 RepID=UPI003438C566